MSMASVERSRPHINTITLDRPERLNAMSFGLVSDLYRAIEEVGADNDCWVAVLTGAGRGFCSGLDLEDVGICPGIEGLTVARAGMRAMAYMSNLVPAMRVIPQPIIAAINGPAYGGGLCLALGSDIRIAAESATFCAAGINNGLTSTELGASYLLPRLIGGSRASEILLTGREFDAVEAERIGLVSRVVPDAEVLDTALETAEQICAWSPHGVAMTKQVIWANREISSLAAAIEIENRNQLLLGMTTRNLDEAVAARRENREPHYRDL
jgi:enoyl-CoA hydratase